MTGSKINVNLLISIFIFYRAKQKHKHGSYGLVPNFIWGRHSP